MRIAVAGGTGWLGKLIVERLNAAGDDVVVLARSTGVDLTSGEGLAEKLDGVETIIDATNIVTRSKRASVDFFRSVSGNLMTAAKQAGVGHVVAISIIGADIVDLPYYFGKRVQEDLVLHGDVPGTVVRVSQFHEFAAQMLAAKGVFVIAPKILSQPIGIVDVAPHMVELAHREPQGLAPDLAGPDEHLRMQDMVKRLAKVVGERRPIVPIGMPGKVGKQLTGGDLLPTGPGPRGTQTFDQWLDLQTAAQGMTRA